MTLAAGGGSSPAQVRMQRGLGKVSGPHAWLRPLAECLPSQAAFLQIWKQCTDPLMGREEGGGGI